jgi:hypothetical protein
MNFYEKDIFIIISFIFFIFNFFSGYNMWNSESLYKTVTFLYMNLSDNNLFVGQTL